MPSQRFQRFEKVIVTTVPRCCPNAKGQQGAILWADPPQRPSRTDEWAYSIFIPTMGRCITVLESNLRSTGEFDTTDAHLGTRFEISHDLLPNERGEFFFVEGTYRRPGKFWEVMIFTKEDVPTLRHRFGTWESGITGVIFQVPNQDPLDKSYVLRAMNSVFSADEWAEVTGPDSMVLR